MTSELWELCKDAACVYMRSEFANFYVSGNLEEEWDAHQVNWSLLFTKTEREVKHLGAILSG